MTYELAFKPSALKEWQALDASVRAQFKRVLVRRLDAPHIESARLHGMPDCYKIKLRAFGYRLVYQIEADVLCVTVIAVGKRERSEVYASAAKRLKNTPDK